MKRETCIFQGRPRKINNKITLIKVLLEVSEVDKIERNRSSTRQEEMVDLPFSMALIKKLLAKRSKTEGVKYQINRNTLNLKNLTSVSALTGKNQDPKTKKVETIKLTTVLPDRSEMYYADGAVEHDLEIRKFYALNLAGQKVKLSDNLTKNYFGLEKGPLLNDNATQNEIGANCITQKSDMSYPLFDYCRKFETKNSGKNPFESFAKNESSFSSVPGLFNSSSNLDNLKPFKFEGEEFKKDPFSYTPTLMPKIDHFDYSLGRKSEKKQTKKIKNFSFFNSAA